MLKTICDILGCTRRKQMAQKLIEEIHAMQEQQEKQKQYQAALGGEDDWFRRVCTESGIQEVDNGHITSPVSVRVRG